MSFCRWSSDNFTCDLYCYESDFGFVTHVAGVKLVETVPPLVWDKGPEELYQTYRAQAEALKKVTRVPIGLPYDGQSFTDPDLESFLARVEHLRATGYRVPDHVFEEIKEEIKDERRNAAGTSGE